MKAIRNTVILKFKNNKAWQDEIDFGDGQKIYIEGSLKVEHNAHSVGEVVESGIDGINKGDKLGVSYQVLSNYDWIGQQRVFNNSFEMDGDVLFIAGKDFILCKIKEDGSYEQFGEWILMKPVIHESKSEILTLGVDTRANTNVLSGEGEYVCGDIDAKEGQRCLFQEKFRSEYSFGWKNDFIVLKKDYIYAVRN